MFILTRLLEEYHAKGNKLCMFCGPRESIQQSNEKCVGMGNEEEMNTRRFYLIPHTGKSVQVCMREQGHESEWILSCQRSLRLE